MNRERATIYVIIKIMKSWQNKNHREKIRQVATLSSLILNIACLIIYVNINDIYSFLATPILTITSATLWIKLLASRHKRN